MYTHPKHDLKLQYPKVLEVSTALALILLTLALMISKKFEVDVAFKAVDAPALQLEDIPYIPHKRVVEVPQKPTIPVEDPLAEIEDDMDILFPDFHDISIGDPPQAPPMDGTVDFYKVEVKPTLKGGNQTIVDYISRHNLFPGIAREAGISGQAQIGFIVDENGFPQNVIILQEKPSGLGFGEAAVKVMQAMRFNPGLQRDKAVSVSMKQSISFSAR